MNASSESGECASLISWVSVDVLEIAGWPAMGEVDPLCRHVPCQAAHLIRLSFPWMRMGRIRGARSSCENRRDAWLGLLWRRKDNISLGKTGKRNSAGEGARDACRAGKRKPRRSGRNDILRLLVKERAHAD